MAELLVAQVVVRIDEKVAQRVPCGHGHVGAVAAVFARVFVRNVQAVGDVQVHEDALQVFGRVVKEHLFVGLAAVGDVFDVVVPESQVEDIAARKSLALISVVDVFRPAQNVADGIAGQDLRLDSVVKRFQILHDHRLLGR